MILSIGFLGGSLFTYSYYPREAQVWASLGLLGVLSLLFSLLLTLKIFSIAKGDRLEEASEHELGPTKHRF